MTRTVASLCCALLLCVLGAAAATTTPARRGHCVGRLCSFQAFLDFDGARDACVAMGAKLLAFGKEEEDLKAVPSGFGGGRFWLSLDGVTKKEDCPSVSLKTLEVLWGPCADKLDGFFCQYADGDVCKPFGGAQVRFVTMSGFNLTDSETLPPGTVATVAAEQQQPGAEHPDSKHLCFASVWTRAPWRCEVMEGGCESKCGGQVGPCECPEGESLHPNGLSCVRGPARACPPGYKRSRDGKGCEDVDECAEERDPCAAEGEECVNNEGGYECLCAEGFVMEKGACVNVTICNFCEHMKCPKVDGVYRCACRKGYVVSARNPTKCERKCTERDCPAHCIPNEVGPDTCYCPDGFVRDDVNGTVFCTDINECEDKGLCDHRCENYFGGHRCLCEPGYEVRDVYNCVKSEVVEEEGSGEVEVPTTTTATTTVTPARLQPAEAAVPPFVKTGSILGIAVFLLLCAALLAFVARNAVRRCGRFELATFKHPDLDLYYLQQVTTETYKRLSFDRPQKEDAQRF